MRIGNHHAGLVLALLAGLGGCNSADHEAATDGVRQTRFPGQVTAGGSTSGEVMARASQVSGGGRQVGTPGIPQGAGGNTGGARTPSATTAVGGAAGAETSRGQSLNGVAGTPSIPEGAGGNTSGAAMGGTTAGAAATKAAPTPEHSGTASAPGQGK